MLLEQLTKCIVLIIIAGACLAQDAKIVDRWADNIGTEIQDLANSVARPDELKERYKKMNTIVVKKSGEELIKIISESVGRMLRRKMDAVRCILNAAETAAEEYEPEVGVNITYLSGKYSNFTGATEYVPLPETMEPNASVYREADLIADSHFYNIPVNTNISSVHIPSNVYDLLPRVVDTINWSETLDETFRQNYKSDPALSWQYFGSVTGMLRQYPAMQWRTDKKADLSTAADEYDCRTRSWFIEAATCSKDMVILVDNSGSMEGMGRTIAITTVNYILDTLSNNDFVTVLKYGNETSEIVPCFKDKLIQATPENIKIFKNMTTEMDPTDIANLTDGFVRAFSLLKTYSDARGCGVKTPCNQLIMLVTDGVATNISEVFDVWNRPENSTIPVRVFTYLLGREVTNVREIQLMACLNRGYYTHIKTQEEAREQVLKYIPVVARPLVLQGDVHPVVWTHAYADISNPALATWLWIVMEHKGQKSRLEKYLKGKQQGVKINEDSVYIKQLGKDENVRADPADLKTTLWQEYSLLTSVSIPAFDRKGNRDNRTRRANLLGVAGTDVPINDIRKLTLPYKLGVNGYAFIVSNNGYVILHPDLRPVFEGKLKLNYNSIDLTEVEILDDGRGPRDPGPEVLALRKALVEHQNDSMLNIPVKLHYDDNRRVTLEKRDYYYAPLPGTPFGIAVAIPNYGKTWVKVQDVILNRQKININISDFFVGDHWRVHKNWIYCKFHYLEGHEFKDGETELKYFLRQMGEDNWKWSDQYQAYSNDTEQNPEEPDCTHRVLQDDDYYCNRELVELLVFDANATNEDYNSKFEHYDKKSKDLANTWGIFLRFVATQSGLTRWQDLDSSHVPGGKNRTKFGDLYKRAIDEPWYKGAIFQHQIDHNSISITVPWKAGANAVVTASLAIVAKDGELNTTVAVVGFQMAMKNFYERFIEITSTDASPRMNCSRPEIDCYLIDQNGFVVISELHKDIGKFFGVVEAPVMKSMVMQNHFAAVEVYDYQGLCGHPGKEKGSASYIKNPLQYVWKLFLWMIGRIMWMTTEFVNLPEAFAKGGADDDLPGPPPKPRETKYTYACDKKSTLYIVNHTRLNTGITDSPIQCSRPFFAKRVPGTNLLLVVVDATHWTCHEILDVIPEIIEPSDYIDGTEDPPCHKKNLNELPRRRLENCYTEHPLEDEIDACGRGTKLNCFSILSILIILKILL